MRTAWRTLRRRRGVSTRAWLPPRGGSSERERDARERPARLSEVRGTPSDLAAPPLPPHPRLGRPGWLLRPPRDRMRRPAGLRFRPTGSRPIRILASELLLALPKEQSPSHEKACCKHVLQSKPAKRSA